jgi:hypothetical protein
VDGEPTIASSARRHGIDHTDIAHAFDHPLWIEDLDERLRSQGTTSRGTCLDPGRLVDLVAHGGHLGTGVGLEQADVEGRALMEPEPQDDVFWIEVAPPGDPVDGVG